MPDTGVHRQNTESGLPWLFMDHLYLFYMTFQECLIVEYSQYNIFPKLPQWVCVECGRQMGFGVNGSKMQQPFDWFSTTFQAWITRILNPMTFQDLYASGNGVIDAIAVENCCSKLMRACSICGLAMHDKSSWVNKSEGMLTTWFLHFHTSDLCCKDTSRITEVIVQNIVA